MTRPTHDVCASMGEYTARDGSKKKRYVKVGTLFRYEDGGLSLKMDTVPVGPGWSGWLTFFEIKGREEVSEPATTQRKSTPTPDTGEDDDIPF